MPLDPKQWEMEQIENGYIPDKNGKYHYKIKDGEQK